MKTTTETNFESTSRKNSLGNPPQETNVWFEQERNGNEAGITSGMNVRKLGSHTWEFGCTATTRFPSRVNPNGPSRNSKSCQVQNASAKRSNYTRPLLCSAQTFLRTQLLGNTRHAPGINCKVHGKPFGSFVTYSSEYSANLMDGCCIAQEVRMCRASNHSMCWPVPWKDNNKEEILGVQKRGHIYTPKNQNAHIHTYSSYVLRGIFTLNVHPKSGQKDLSLPPIIISLGHFLQDLSGRSEAWNPKFK